MIDRAHDLPITKQAAALTHQSGERLLPAAAGVGSRPRAHASTAAGIAFRRLADLRGAGREVRSARHVKPDARMGKSDASRNQVEPCHTTGV